MLKIIERVVIKIDYNEFKGKNKTNYKRNGRNQIIVCQKNKIITVNIKSEEIKKISLTFLENEEKDSLTITNFDLNKLTQSSFSFIHWHKKEDTRYKITIEKRKEKVGILERIITPRQEWSKKSWIAQVDEIDLEGKVKRNAITTQRTDHYANEILRIFDNEDTVKSLLDFLKYHKYNKLKINDNRDYLNKKLF